MPTVFKLGKNGYFDAGIGVILGVPDNGYADFQIRAWRGMASYELAILVGLRTGLSPRWQQKVGSWDSRTAARATGTALEMRLPTYSGNLELVAPPATKVYQVRAVSKYSSGSGSFTNLSTGVFITVN